MFVERSGNLWSFDAFSCKLDFRLALAVSDLTGAQPTPNGVLLYNSKQLVVPPVEVHRDGFVVRVRPKIRARLVFEHNDVSWALKATREGDLLLVAYDGKNTTRVITHRGAIDTFYCQGCVYLLHRDLNLFGVEVDSHIARQEDTVPYLSHGESTVSCRDRQRYYVMNSLGEGACFDCESRSWSRLPRLNGNARPRCLAVCGDRLFVKRANTLEECVDGRWVVRLKSNLDFTAGFHQSW